MSRMSDPLGPPQNLLQPFFAYGIFRPEQIAYFQIKETVRSAKAAEISGVLKVRDGLPILDAEDSGFVSGELLEFRSAEDCARAYERISALEPQNQYRWGELNVDGVTANVLLGKSPKKGSIQLEEREWNGWNDPLFTAALDVVEETLQSQSQPEWDLKPTFRIQMSYLLLWSAIERYAGLRHYFGDKVDRRVECLASERAFAEALQKHAGEHEPVYRADRPKKCIFDKNRPEKALDYYYQVRSNITHRGKGVPRDHDRVLRCGNEMLNIFRDVLDAAKREAGYTQNPMR